MWGELLAALVRHGLTIVATWLVARGIIDEQLGGELVGQYSWIANRIIELGIVLSPLLLSWINKMRHKIELKVALGADPGTEPEEVSRISREMPLSEALREKGK